MAIYKCKMCGAQLEVAKGSTIATCSFCMSKQTVANADDERKENLFNRANTLRIKCEFDKALLAYQSILSLFPHEPEAHWGVVLCKYGIEYVDDPISKSKKPTIHRMAYESILKDSDYLETLAYADVIAKSQYEEEATQIANIQKNILSISQKEEPFDIFICYKETDKDGNRTHDSVMAQEIYTTLVDKGYKVFFSKITLENKLGTMYEPYIFAALNSAKIMLVIGTKQEHFNAVWVKNEWSRFISLMQTRPDHYLIPCYKDMNAYDMPEEFLCFQAQDLSKLGFMQDLIRGIDKIMGNNVNKVQVVTREVKSNINIEGILNRSEILISEQDYQKADELLEQVLNEDPKNSKAHLLKCLIDLNLRSIDELKNQDNVLDNNSNFARAYKYGNKEQKEELDAINQYIDNRNKDKTYNLALSHKDKNDFEEAIKTFNQIIDFKDAKKQIEECERLKLKRKYQKALSLKEQKKYKQAIEILKTIINYEDASYQIEECKRLIEERRKEAIYVTCLLNKEVNTSHIKLLKDNCKKLASIQGYKNSDMLLSDYESKIKELEKQKKEKKARRIKKVKIVSTIVTTITAILTFVILLTTMHIIPEINENEIEKLIDDRNYAEAYERLENKNYGHSKKLIEMCKAGEAFDSLDFETGISLIYNIGGTIDVNYYKNGDISIKTHETIKKKGFINNELDTKVGYISRWKLTTYALKSSKFYAAIDLEEHYDIINYTITYDLDGGNCENLPSTYTIEDTIKLANPTKTGYTFMGWTCSETDTPKKDYIIQKGTIGNKTFKANWKINEYKIYLNADGGEVSEKVINVTYNSNYNLPTPTRTGHTFIGWFNADGMEFNSGKYTFANDLYLTARWSANSYGIRIINSDTTAGNVEGSGIYKYGTSVTISATANEGYKFTGWYDEQGTCVSTQSTYTFSMGLYQILTAKWDYAEITLNYIVDGEVVHQEPYKLNNNITNFYQYQTDKNFYGWYNKATFNSTDTKVTTTKGLTIVDNNAYLYGVTLDTKFDFIYKNNGYEITKYNDTKTDVIIPSSINGISVTSIENAFYECSSLTSIVIPNSVTNIGNNAFYGCSSLTSIYIPNTVTTMGSNVFSGSNSLTILCETKTRPSGWDSSWNYYRPVYWGVTEEDLIIQDGLQYLIINEEAVVAGHEVNITNIVIPSTITVNGKTYNVTSIGNLAFGGCSSLTSLEIPNSIISIGNRAFEGCSSLTSIFIPNSVTSIGVGVFSNECSNLTIYCEASSKPNGWNLSWNKSDRLVYWGATEEDVIIQDGLQYLISNGEAVVTGHDTNITNVVIPSTIIANGTIYNVTNIGNYAFYSCSSLTSITIPNSVTSIGEYAFKGCSSLTSVTFEEGSNLISIGSNAFDGCSSLTSITIPNGVTSIESSVFSGCSSLVSIVIPNSVTSIGSNAFNGCGSLTSIEIPNSVTIIESGAFSGCRFLTSIVIPNSVTIIESNAFSGCSSLAIFCEANCEPIGWDSAWNPNNRPVYWGPERKK